jgi:polyisoprenyl-phosphate glycosyltransferase
MKLSVVIPVYNSERTINALVVSLLKTLEEYDTEIVLVNDCSKDRSEFVCESLAKKNPLVKFISLRKNKGEHNAVLCGLNYCTGDYVAIIDDDLQNPPSEIIKLLHKACKQDYDVVYGNYESKKHSFFRNICSNINNSLATHFIKKPKGLYLSSFKIISGEILPELISYKGPFPYIDALILRCTSNIGWENVIHEDRKHGRSNYTFRKLFSLYLNIVINFSFAPLRVVTIAGIGISILSFLTSGYIIYEKLFLKNLTPGWAFLSVLLLFSIGVTFIVIGILGEYIGKILMTLNNSPQYTIKKQINTETGIEALMKIEYDREVARV